MDNYNYPMGADNSLAPWNEREKEEMEFDCEVLYTMRSVQPVSTRMYEVDGPEPWNGDYGGVEVSTDNVDWYDEWCDCGLSPITIMHEFANLAERWMDGEMFSGKDKMKIGELIKEAREWIEVDVEVEKL